MEFSTTRYLQRLSLVLITQIVLSSAIDSTASFLYPLTPLNIDVADTVLVQWSSDYANASMYTWTRAPDLSGVAVTNPFNVMASDTLTYSLPPTIKSFPAEIWFNLIYINASNPSARQGVNSPSLFYTSQANKIGTTYARTFTSAAVASASSASSSATTTQRSSVSAASSATANSYASSAGASATSSNSGSSSPATVTGSNSASSSDSTSKNSGLGTSAYIGIGVGIGVAVILIAVLAFFGLRMHRRNLRLKQQLAANGTGIAPVPYTDKTYDSTPPRRKMDAELLGRPLPSSKSPVATNEYQHLAPPQYQGVSGLDRYNAREGHLVELDAGRR